MQNKVIIFDIWADVGHFKKVWTTTSPLTYSFPPRTTIAGIISAMLGLKRDSYYKTFNSSRCNIAVRIINPIKKGRFNTNLINTKDSPFRIKNTASARTQISFEILKNPKYRIYFRHEDLEIYNKLLNCLQKGNSFYNITFGLANCLANFKFISESEIEESELNEIDSVVPIDKIKKICEYGENFKVKLPVDFDKNRIATYKEYLFGRNKEPMKLETKGFIVKETQERISFL